MLSTTESPDDLMPPQSKDWINNASKSDKTLLSIASTITAIVCLIGLVEFYFVIKHIKHEDIRRNVLWLVFMLPVATLLASLGMYFPRSCLFLYILGICYIMICLMILVRFMRVLFGSRTAIIDYMRQNHLSIDMNAPPICPSKCCRCMPQVGATERNIYIFEYLVYQTVFVRIIGETIIMMMYMENAFKTNPFFDTANSIFMISILISIYGCEVLKKIGQQKLSQYYFASLYVMINITQATYTGSKSIFDTLLNHGTITVGALVTAEARSQFLVNFTFCCFALLLSLFSIYILRPSKNALFDDYRTKQEEIRVSYE